MNEPHVHILATLTSKGQVTIPKSVRDALLLATGDKISFVVAGREVTIAKEPDFLELAGSVKVSASKRDVPFDQVRKSARAKSAGRRMAS